MGNWRVAIGNLVNRAPADPAAVAPSAASGLYPLTALGDGFADEAGRWAFNSSSGVYEALFDLNLLAQSTPRADAPVGWADLTNHLAGTPGLPANPPDFGTYAARTALRLFHPSFQVVDVMPDEDGRVRCAIYLPSGSTGIDEVRCKVTNLATGREHDGTVWTDADDIVSVTTTDTWTDVDVSIPWETAAPDERAKYRITFYGLLSSSPAGGATHEFYVSAHSGDDAAAIGPGFFMDQDFVAIIGHNVPQGSTVEWEPSGAAAWSLSSLQPSFFFQNGSALSDRIWSLRVTVPEPNFVEPPYIGELWAGALTDMAWCPAFPFDLTVADAGQVRIPGGYGRQSVFSDAARAQSRLKMNFEADEAGYLQARDFLEGATRHGADPLLILPVAELEGATAIYHARVQNEVAYSRRNLARRRYSITALEDPFPRF